MAVIEERVSVNEVRERYLKETQEKEIEIKERLDRLEKSFSIEEYHKIRQENIRYRGMVGADKTTFHEYTGRLFAIKERNNGTRH